MSRNVEYFKVSLTALQQTEPREDAILADGNAFCVDSKNFKVGIGKRPASNGASLQMAGNMDATGDVYAEKYHVKLASDTEPKGTVSWQVESGGHGVRIGNFLGQPSTVYVDFDPGSPIGAVVVGGMDIIPANDGTRQIGTDTKRWNEANLSARVRVGNTTQAQALLVSHSSAANLFRVDASLGTPAVGINRAPVSGEGRLQVAGDARVLGVLDVRDSTNAGTSTLTVTSGSLRTANVPTGGTYEWHINASKRLELTATKLLCVGDLEIDGALDHDGSTVGFYGVTPVSRPSAYTQTYSTATRTHSNPTQSSLSLGSAVEDLGWGFASAADFNATIAAVNAARTDVLNVKQVLNQVIDDLQANGLLQ